MSEESEYLEKINAPLDEATVEAINADLRSGRHARWITTRQKLIGDPEALAAYDAERERRLAEWAAEEGWERLERVSSTPPGPTSTGTVGSVTEASQGPCDMPPDPPQATWRIWSNVHQKWYLPQARGYTPNIEESGRFMPMEAIQIYEHCARGWDPHHPFDIKITLVPA